MQQVEWCCPRNKLRVNMRVIDRKKEWRNSPFEAHLNFASLLDRAEVPNRKFNTNSIRIVEYDSQTGQALTWNDGLEGAEKFYVPYKLDESFNNYPWGTVSWIKKNPGDGYYSIYFDLEGSGLQEPPQELPLVGNGDALTFGRRGVIGDLRGGLWTSVIVTDWDDDGDLDVLVSHSDYNGATYLFENVIASPRSLPLLSPRGRIEGLLRSEGCCRANGVPTLVNWGEGKRGFITCAGRCVYYSEIKETRVDTHRPVFKNPIVILFLGDNFHPGTQISKVEVVDWDGDGTKDLLVGIDDWTDYWPRGISAWEGNVGSQIGFAERYTKEGKWVGGGKGYAQNGKWLGGSLHGYIYFFKNHGTNEEPIFQRGVRLCAGEDSIDVYGWPTPSVGDWDGDGDLDLICGDFSNTITYFENIGTRTRPKLAAGAKIRGVNGKILKMPQNIVAPVVVDWNNDGRLDIIAGAEDGYVYFLENAAKDKRFPPRFKEPVCLQQIDPPVATGIAAVPAVVDWDNDGDLDLIVGSGAGFIYYVENLGNQRHPRFGQPVHLRAGGKEIRIQAGYSGDIQGPSEARWGYTCPIAVDWDKDGLVDIIISDVKGEHTFFKNIGTKNKPSLASGEKIQVEGKDLVTAWRVRPVAVDWNNNGLLDYVCLDQEGYLTLYERFQDNGVTKLRKGKRFCYVDGKHIKLDGEAGMEGRTKLSVADWDRDGDWDIIYGTFHGRVMYMENVGSNDQPLFTYPRPLLTINGQPIKLGTHSAAPEAVDWDEDGIVDLIVGAEDGRILYFHRSYLAVEKNEINKNEWIILSVENRDNLESYKL